MVNIAEFQIQKFGINTLLITWPNEINELINHDIISFDDLIIEKFNSSIVDALWYVILIFCVFGTSLPLDLRNEQYFSNTDEFS